MPTVSPIEPEEVMVDVQPWLAAMYAQLPNEQIPMTGVLRHADLLCRYFTPAAIVMPGETHHTQGCLERLEQYLKRKIVLIEREATEIYSLEEEIRRVGCRLWLSIAPDCSGPAVSMTLGIKGRSYMTACIVHDTQAVGRSFGEQNKFNFLRAMQFTDIFLPVSHTAETQFIEFWHHLYAKGHEFNVKRLANPYIIPYACTHGLSYSPMVRLGERNLISHRGWFSMSLHSLYPHKNLFAVGDLVDYFDSHHIHIGGFAKPNEVEIVHCIEKGVHFAGHVSDAYTRLLLQDADLFICLSREEGFSMPAMEAILAGVPRIILSDIPAHQEIYGGTYGVTFVDPESPISSLEKQDYRKISDLPKVSEENRMVLFNRYQPKAVLNDFFNWLSHPVVSTSK